MGLDSSEYKWYLQIFLNYDLDKKRPQPRKVLYDTLKQYYSHEKNIEEVLELFDKNMNLKILVNNYLCFFFDRLIKYAGFHSN